METTVLGYPRIGGPRELKKATESFWAGRSARSGWPPPARPARPRSTRTCYSEFGEILGAIGAMDADVTSIEAARSRIALLADLRAAGYARGIGPGIYDIHSPRVPTVAEMTGALRRALETVEPGRLGVNPDCGLKTRGYDEAEPALRNLVTAARNVRAALEGWPASVREE